jgi:hypothetical protein
MNKLPVTVLSGFLGTAGRRAHQSGRGYAPLSGNQGAEGVMEEADTPA